MHKNQAKVPTQPVVTIPLVIYPTIGWQPAYDDAIKKAVTNNMLAQPNAVMTQFCAEWPELSFDQRRQMYSDLFYSIALPESNYDRKSLYYEDELGSDPLTDLPVVSEGLLQLSYQDVLSYPSCKFNASADKVYINDDWNNRNGKQSWESKHVNGKTILDPFNNLLCGISIVDDLLKSSPTKEFSDNLGRYWSSMRRTSDAYSDIWIAMKKRGSPCH